MNTFSVRPEMVSNLASDIATDVQGISEALDDLDSQVRSLISNWDGSAQEAYHTAQAQWTQDLQEMNTILSQISSATSTISQQYVESDNRSAARF